MNITQELQNQEAMNNGNKKNKFIETCKNVFQKIKYWSLVFGAPLFDNRVRIKDVPKNHSRLAISLIKEELSEVVAELDVALSKNNDLKLQSELSDLLWVTVRAMQTFGYDPEKSINALFDANMSKSCATIECAEETVRLYKEGKHPLKKGEKIDCYFVKIHQPDNDYFLIKRYGDDKILKSVNTKKPNYGK